MAIYHCSISVYSRGKGETATGAACYRAGLKMTDERTGLQHNYTKRKGVIGFDMVVPAGSPAWAKDPGQCWNQVEKSENRKDATLGRDFEISLPHELDLAQRENLAIEITGKLVSKFGFAAMYALHSPEGKEDQRNHHVHILTSDRKLTAAGFGQKVKELNLFTGGKENTVWVRQMVADTINQHLERAGINSTVSHKSLIDQQVDAAQRKDFKQAILLSREPTRHIGRHPHFMEVNKAKNEEIRHANKQSMKELLADLETAITLSPKKEDGESGMSAEAKKINESLLSGDDAPMPAMMGGGGGGGGSSLALISQIKQLQSQIGSMHMNKIPHAIGLIASLRGQLANLELQLAKAVEEESKSKSTSNGMGAGNKPNPAPSPLPPEPQFKIPIPAIPSLKIEPPGPPKPRFP